MTTPYPLTARQLATIERDVEKRFATIAERCTQALCQHTPESLRYPYTADDWRGLSDHDRRAIAKANLRRQKTDKFVAKVARMVAHRSSAAAPHAAYVRPPLAPRYVVACSECGEWQGARDARPVVAYCGDPCKPKRRRKARPTR